MRTDPEVRLIRAILLLVGIALFGVVVMVGVVIWAAQTGWRSMNSTKRGQGVFPKVDPTPGTCPGRLPAARLTASDAYAKPECGSSPGSRDNGASPLASVVTPPDSDGFGCRLFLRFVRIRVAPRRDNGYAKSEAIWSGAPAWPHRPSRLRQRS